MIGVVIVTYHSEKHIGTCLASVFSQNIPIRVVIVDNASKDKSLEIAERFPDILVLKNDTNEGFSKAVNRGVQRLLEDGVEYILLLNPDTHLEKNSLHHMMKTLENDSKRMIVQPLLTLMKEPKIMNTWGNEYKGFGIVSLGGYRKPVPTQEDKMIQYASGACMLVRSEAFRKRGLLDERYFLYFEDTEFSERIRKGGDEIWLSSEAKVRHDYRKPLSLRKLGSYLKSWTRFRGLTKK
jgi:GT2 family glycosyltransferase